MIYFFAFIGVVVCVWIVSDLLSKNSSLKSELNYTSKPSQLKSVTTKTYTNIVREDGMYIAHIRTRNEFASAYIVQIIFFIQNYICFEWQEVDELININLEFRNDMFEWRKEISSAIQSGDIDSSEALHKFTKYKLKPSGILEAKFMDDEESSAYKLINLNSNSLGEVFLSVETNRMVYDFIIPENSGFKINKYIDRQKLDFYRY